MLPDPRPYFAGLSDPRREAKSKLHKLSDILMIVFCAVLRGVEDWVGMEEFAEQQEAWFRGFLELPNGIPSHDTLSDVFGRLCPNAFAEAFQRWAQTALPSLADEPVCLDGKTLRGSRTGKAKDHGRIEVRRYVLSAEIAWLAQKPEWTGLQAVGRVESIRILGD